MAIGLVFVIGQQGTAHKANVTNASNTVNNTSSVNVEKINTENTANSNQESSKSSDWIDSMAKNMLVQEKANTWILILIIMLRNMEWEISRNHLHLIFICGKG